MTQSQPPITSTTHTLPFDKLSPRDFERLCLWLVKREGYERAEHLGAAGSEQGRDIVAWREGLLWAFQCKRVQRFGPKDALTEVEKVLALPEDQRPVGLVFLVTCDVSANTRQQVRDHCAGEMECHFWAGTELDQKVKQHPDIVEEFFQADRGRSRAGKVHDYLAQAVAAYEARMYQLVARPAAPPDQPYKFLYAFEIKDADIFFGRDAASKALHQTVLKDHLTVLHAKSGAGKTSLLNAGLSPRLIREGRLPVYARAYEDPIRAIKRTIAPPSLGPWPELLSELSLHEFLGLTCAHLSRQTQELMIILDQFEEFFIFWPEPDRRQSFVDALADCYDDKSLPMRLIIALRKDYYSDLATFQRRLPHVFHNEYYLDAMTREEVQAAITGPVAKLVHPVTYEQALLDTQLDDLARGAMELPHLQVICTQLYEALAEGETVIALTSYEGLGRAEGMVGGYLNNVLDRLPGNGGVIAREVLKELVSSEATKRVLSYDTLAARVEAGRDELDDVLARLIDARLLHRDESAGEITYEMAHEYLIEEIKTWIDQADLAFKQVEELLEREVANWHVHGSLIPRDRLEVLYTQRERFRGLDDDAWGCILCSAIQADFALEDWVKLVGNVRYRRILIAGLVGQQPPVARVQAGDGLARLGDLRPGVGVDPETGLPDIAWCYVPPGPFVMGSADDDEMAYVYKEPQHRNESITEGYLISRYPITNAQFAVFVEAGGYRERRYWTEAGWQWKGGRTGPETYGDVCDLPNHPVVMVTWYGAVAFCRWLQERLQITDYRLQVWREGELETLSLEPKTLRVRLPSEAEWEKAARGTDGRWFPWGKEPDPNRANYGNTGIGTTSAVGCFPGGASPYGVEDLSGNVWEWTRSLWGEDGEKSDFGYPYDPGDGRENPEAERDVRRVLRGGEFDEGAWSVRCACRLGVDPDSHWNSSGFRVVASPVTSGLWLL